MNALQQLAERERDIRRQQNGVVRVDPDSIRIEHLRLPARAYNCLLTDDVRTLADILKYSERELLRFPGMGRKSVRDIADAVGRYGYSISGVQSWDAERLHEEIENIKAQQEALLERLNALLFQLERMAAT